MSTGNANDGLVKAPWNDEQVANLNAFQSSRRFHPFTCGGDRGNEAHKQYAREHGGDNGQLVATEDGFVCPVRIQTGLGARLHGVAVTESAAESVEEIPMAKKQKDKLIVLIEREYRGDHGRILQWKKSLPFFDNPRGVLIHRVESVTTFNVNDDRPHIAVRYVCGNSTTDDDTKEHFLAAPPANRLLCARCEFIAKQTRRPSADEIVGRHVHIGRVVAERVCCQDKSNTN